MGYIVFIEIVPDEPMFSRLPNAIQMTEDEIEKAKREQKERFELEDQGSFHFKEQNTKLQSALRKQVQLKTLRTLDAYSVLSVVEEANQPADLVHRARVESCRCSIPPAFLSHKLFV